MCRKALLNSLIFSLFFCASALAGISDLPDVEDLSFSTEGSPQVAQDAIKAGTLERMISHLSSIGRYRDLTKEEESRIKTYKWELGRLYGVYKANGDHDQYVRFMNDAATVKLQTGDKYIQQVSPQLLAEFKRLVPKREPKKPSPVKTYPTDVSYAKSGGPASATPAYIALGVIALGLGIFAFRKFLEKQRSHYAVLNQRALQQFGETKEERADAIAAFLNNPLSTIKFSVDVQPPQCRLRFTIERNINTFGEHERMLLFVCYQFANEGGFSSENNFHHIRYALIYGRGQGQRVKSPNDIVKVPEGRDPMQELAAYIGVNVDGAETILVRELTDALNRDPLNPVYRRLVDIVLQKDYIPHPSQANDIDEAVDPPPLV